MPIQNKICSKCRVEKPLSEFYPHKKHSLGVSSACKECTRRYAKESYYARPNKKISGYKYRKSLRGAETRKRYVQTAEYKFNRWRYWIKSEYNLTPEQYDKLLQAQGDACQICGKPETACNQYGLMRLAIDHDHTTGKIRGLLCQKCNQAIGLTGENVEILKQIIKYLGQYEK